jgi:hypothetical protein
MEPIKNVREEEAKKIVDDMNESNELALMEEMIKNNKIEFEYEDKKYRIRMLNLKEKEELDLLRRKKFGQLIQDKDILLEKDLIKIYKDRGIDIEEIDNEIKDLIKKELDLELQLGESISKKDSENVLKMYKEKILQVRYQKAILSSRKVLFLEFSLENQLFNYVAQVITYLSLDVFEDDEWKRMFETLDKFQSYSDEKLINKAGVYSMALQG